MNEYKEAGGELEEYRKLLQNIINKTCSSTIRFGNKRAELSLGI